MSVAYISNSRNYDVSNTISVGLTIGVTTNFLLITVTVPDNSRNVTNPAYTGGTLVPLGSSVSGTARVWAWGVYAPTTGTFTATLSASNGWEATGVQFSGVVYVDPLGYLSESGTNNPSLIVSVNRSGGMAVDVLSTSGTSTITIGADQTSIAANTTFTSMRKNISYETNNGSKTMSWSFGSAMNFGHWAISLEASFPPSTSLLTPIWIM
jgi:hypothetical protein